RSERASFGVMSEFDGNTGLIGTPLITSSHWNRNRLPHGASSVIFFITAPPFWPSQSLHGRVRRESSPRAQRQPSSIGRTAASKRSADTGALSLRTSTRRLGRQAWLRSRLGQCRLRE